MFCVSGSLIWSKTLMELIFNPCGKFRWSPEGPVSQIHSPHLHAGAPGIISDILRSIQTLKREWGAESNGRLPHLFIPSKTATLVPEFAVEDLTLGRTAALVPGFAMEDLPLGRTLWWYICMYVCVYVCKVFFPEKGPFLDMHYQGSAYLRLLDKRKEWGSMSSPFLTEPVALWEYPSLHTQTQDCCKHNY